MTATPTPDDGALAADRIAELEGVLRYIIKYGERSGMKRIQQVCEMSLKGMSMNPLREEPTLAPDPAPDAAATTALYVCNFLAGFNVSPMEFVKEVEGLIRRHMGCGSGDPPKNLTLPENASTDTPLPHGASHPETQ